LIGSFRHKGLKRFYEEGDGRDLRADQLKRIGRVLMVLENAGTIDNMDMLPGMRLHRLKGDMSGFWSVSVSGNWRVIFRFDDGQALDVDLVDYH